MFGGKEYPPDDGLDCSGFITTVFKQAGIFDFGAKYGPGYTNVERIYEQCEEFGGVAQPGDLLFFQNTYQNEDGSWERFSHIGYILSRSPTKVMVDAHDNRGVGETLYGAEYWQEHFLDVRRAPGVPTASTAPLVGDAWQWWSPETIAQITRAPLDSVARNWPLIYSELLAVGQASKASCAGVIGTIAIETGSTFEPVEEAYYLDTEWDVVETWRKTHLRYWPFYGRGFIQLTWQTNYQAYGERLNLDLVGQPQLAGHPTIAAKILALYWADRDIQAAADRYDWTKVRLQVQGGDGELDRLKRIANYLMNN